MGSLASLDDDLGRGPVEKAGLGEISGVTASQSGPAVEASIVDLDITVERLRALFSRQGLPELDGDEEDGFAQDA